MGKKTFRRWEGVAADFCPICRWGTPVRVYQIRSQTEVSFIGFGQGDLVGRLCVCTQCGSEWGLRSGTIQSLLQPTLPVSVETLLAETYPRFREVNAERLHQEAVIGRDPYALDPQTRFNLIAEPFFVLDSAMAREDEGFRWETFLGGLGCIGTIGIGLASVFAFFAWGALWGFGLLIATIVIGWGVFKMVTASGRRFMLQKIYPRLVLALAPLDPTPDELRQVVAALSSGNDTSKTASRTELPTFSPLLYDACVRIRAARMAV